MNDNYKICPECHGEGKFVTSSCCGAEPMSTGDSSTEDYGICPECGEHCDYETEICDTCLGFGEIPCDENDDWNDLLNEAESKYESKKNDHD
jgi:RecJ-like exonuclease